MITAEPDITVIDLCADDQFFILACDGVWDCLTNQQAVGVIVLACAAQGFSNEVCFVSCHSATLYQLVWRLICRWTPLLSRFYILASQKSLVDQRVLVLTT